MNDIGYEVWDLGSRNMCETFANEESAIAAAEEYCKLNPGVEFVVTRVTTEDFCETIWAFKNGQRYDPHYNPR